MSNLCRVFGNPISQSKSPQIHALFANQFDLDLLYDKCADGVEYFEDAVSSFFSKEKAVGANVTLPFKQRAYAFSDELSTHALRSGAVNTLHKRGNSIYGDNTDGRGLVWDLQRNNVDLNDANILLIGAGGAAKGCIPALFDAGISKLHISNRTEDKARSLVEQLATDNPWDLGLFDKAQTYDLVINATSLSLSGQKPAIDDDVLLAAQVCYDMVYLDQPTVFLKYADMLGVKSTIDGIGMLVGQAAESFKLWFGLTPDLDSVINALKNHK